MVIMVVPRGVYDDDAVVCDFLWFTALSKSIVRVTRVRVGLWTKSKHTKAKKYLRKTNWD
jgi:hypothetical protein